ncbi:MAG: hypothetical protein WAT77_11835 [Paracoccaceae bacterium]|mgnify:CR=1 FL=1|jgi:hypothetical protein
MGLTDLFLAQLMDPFRIGIVIALVVTMLRTQADTGTWKPLVAGIGFISVLIPLTGVAGKGDLVTAILVGLVSTSVLVAAALLVRTLVLRVMGR